MSRHQGVEVLCATVLVPLGPATPQALSDVQPGDLDAEIRRALQGNNCRRSIICRLPLAHHKRAPRLNRVDERCQMADAFG